MKKFKKIKSKKRYSKEEQKTQIKLVCVEKMKNQENKMIEERHTE